MFLFTLLSFFFATAILGLSGRLAGAFLDLRGALNDQRHFKVLFCETKNLLKVNLLTDFGILRVSA